MMSKIKDYAKIMAVLGLALLASGFMRDNVFLANSPKIRPNFVARIFTNAQRTLARLIPQSPSQALKNVKPELLMKGVYAKSGQNMTATEFKVDEVEWVQYTFTLKDGRVITVKVPKGQTPPSADILQYSQ